MRECSTLGRFPRTSPGPDCNRCFNSISPPAPSGRERLRNPFLKGIIPPSILNCKRSVLTNCTGRMSLPRVSYLESWEPSPASLRRPQDRDQSPGHESDGDNDSYQDLPDSSLSSSFPSAADIPSLRHRLNFNPYAGPGWTQAVVDGGDDDRNPLSRVPSLASKQGKANHATVAEQQGAQQAELGQDAWAPLETTGAFEVDTLKRVCKLKPCHSSFLGLTIS